MLILRWRPYMTGHYHPASRIKELLPHHWKPPEIQDKRHKKLKPEMERCTSSNAHFIFACDVSVDSSTLLKRDHSKVGGHGGFTEFVV